MAIKRHNGIPAADIKLMLNKMNNTAQKIRLGTIVEGQKGCVRGVYDFSVNGGAVSTISLLNEEGEVVKIPDKAVVTTAYIDVITAMASSGGTGTIALTIQSAGDLKAAVDADTLSGIVACIPVGTAATSIKLTAERTLSVAIATEALTAGKFVCAVEYFISK
jgi:hypothetical protein